MTPLTKLMLGAAGLGTVLLVLLAREGTPEAALLQPQQPPPPDPSPTPPASPAPPAAPSTPAPVAPVAPPGPPLPDPLPQVSPTGPFADLPIGAVVSVRGLPMDLAIVSKTAPSPPGTPAFSFIGQWRYLGKSTRFLDFGETHLFGASEIAARLS